MWGEKEGVKTACVFLLIFIVSFPGLFAVSLLFFCKRDGDSNPRRWGTRDRRTNHFTTDVTPILAFNFTYFLCDTQIVPRNLTNTRKREMRQSSRIETAARFLVFCLLLLLQLWPDRLDIKSDETCVCQRCRCTTTKKKMMLALWLLWDDDSTDQQPVQLLQFI